MVASIYLQILLRLRPYPMRGHWLVRIYPATVLLPQCSARWKVQDCSSFAGNDGSAV